MEKGTKLYQFRLSDDPEDVELWQFPDTVTEEQIKVFRSQWGDSDINDFDAFMEEHHSEIECTRLFVEEIYV